MKRRVKETNQQALAITRATVDLLTGKRLEVAGKAGLVLYLGSSSINRPDPFWYEHPGGRTYKREAEEVVRAVLPHVGYEALASAKRFDS